MYAELKNGPSLAEHENLVLKTSSVLCLWTWPGFNRKTVLKHDKPRYLHLYNTFRLSLKEDFRFIEDRNLKQ